MAIKRSDGSVYKIRGPNKLLLNQDFWFNDDKLQLHNFDQIADETISIDSPTTQVIQDRVVDGDEIQNIINAVAEAQPESPKISPEVIDQNKSQFRTTERLYLFCLPTKQVEYSDPLYGDVVMRQVYGDPFRFQASIIKDGDTKVSYWTTVDKIAEQSVVFHPSRLRWWKVQSVTTDPSGDGRWLHCIPSDIQPDFTNELIKESDA